MAKTSCEIVLLCAILLCLLVLRGDAKEDNGIVDKSHARSVSKPRRTRHVATGGDNFDSDTRNAPNVTLSSTNGSCVLRPVHNDWLNETILNYINEKIQMVKYTIVINGTLVEDLIWRDHNEDYIYQPQQWVHIMSFHGKALVNLGFNSEVVSGGMLSFGVKKLTISLEASGCNSSQETVDALRKLLYHDFSGGSSTPTFNYVCNQVMVEERGQTVFHYKCYKHKFTFGEQLEGKVVKNKYIDIVENMLEFVRVFIILFGPLLFHSWIYTGNMQSSVPYKVRLKKEEELEITLKEQPHLLKHASTLTEVLVPTTKKKVPLKCLRHCAEQCSSSCTIHVKTKLMNLIVDHTKLMAQSAVPVSFVTFIRDELLGCGLLKREWIRSCASVGCLLGRWPGMLRANQNPEEFQGQCPPQRPTWGSVFKVLILIIVAVVIVPLPFHIRVGVYIATEETEMESRLEAASQFGFKAPYFENFWYGVEWPSALIILYVLYAFGLTFFSLCQYVFYNNFDDIIQDCIYDLRSVSYASLLSMLCYHLVVPFKQFGCLVGLIIAPFYYVFCAPIAICVALFYGLPTLYMTGRLFYNFKLQGITRPIFCGNRDEPMDDDDFSSVDTRLGSDRTGATFSHIFALDRISPETRLYPRLPVDRIKKRWQGLCRGKILRHILPFFMSLMTVVLMLTLMLMYAEAIRFFLYVLFLMLAGLILNADHTMEYFILAFWTMMYCVRTIKTIHTKYTQMSQILFGYFKEHLKQQVADATRVPEELQNYTAFKYFDPDNLEKIKATMRLYMDKEDRDKYHLDTEDRLVRNPDTGALEWNVHALVLFVDRDDLSRIPKTLFWKICDELRAPGCPGPLRTAIAAAMKQLGHMLLFLFIIYIIIMAFHDVFDPTSNNQLLLTIAGGFLPLIIRQLIPGSPNVDLSEYSVKGKIEEILLHYHQTWSAYDLTPDTDVAAMEEAEDHIHAAEAGAATAEVNNKDRYLEEDINDMVTPEVSGLLGLPPSEARRVSFTRTDAMDEGSVTVDFDDPPIRLPVYQPKERILTFSTVSGPKEDKKNILMPVVKQVRRT